MKSARLILIVFCASIAVTSAGPISPPEDFPTSPPEAPPLEPSSLPPAASHRLDNGMEVVVISSDEIPWVSVTWYLMAGAKYDPPQKSGLAFTTAALLRQGTTTHTADELAELLDFHAIKLGGKAGHETTVVHAGSLAKEVDLAVKCLAEVVRSPVFPERDFRRHISQAVNETKISEAQAEYWAEREFRERVYAEHYLGRLYYGNSETLPRIQREDLVEFHQTHYMPNESKLIFSGSITAEQAVGLARKYFGQWQPGTMPAFPVAPIPPRRDTHIYLVDRPGSTQSQIRVGQLGFRRSDPEYIPAQVFNQVFGGSFNSRLNSAVRVKEGLTYGASGGYTAGKEPGRLMAATFTKNESTAEALEVLLGVAESMTTEAPSKEELSDSQSYITGKFGLSLETPQQVASKVFDLKFHGLADNYYETYLKQINQLTASDVISFAQTAVDLGKLTIVIVGDATEVKGQLAEIAPVTVVKRHGAEPVD